MIKPVTVITKNLVAEPYASVLCYPRASSVELENRIAELHEHGVKALEFSGKGNAFDVPVLGKGFVGIVVIAELNRKKVALKIRRVDADREELQHEAKMLAKANSVQVGPKLISSSKNFLLMQLVDGYFFSRWLAMHKKRDQVRVVLREVLENCWRLDSINLDHGELSNASKHIIINKQQTPFLVDFETASINRKTANVTSVCHFLFTGYGAVAKSVADVLKGINLEEVLAVLRNYKNKKIRENFNNLLHVCLS